MSPGCMNFTGTGYWTGSTLNPSGASNMTFVASPESPGFSQYTCQWVSILSITPTMNGSPGWMGLTSLNNAAWTCSFFAGAAPHASDATIMTINNGTMRRTGTSPQMAAGTAIIPRSPSKVHSRARGGWSKMRQAGDSYNGLSVRLMLT